MSLFSILSNIYIVLNLLILPINQNYYFQAEPINPTHKSKEQKNSIFFNVKSEKTTQTNTLPTKITNDSIGVEVTAKSVLVKDSKTDKILWSKNSDEIRPIASITKLMTAIVLLNLENISWQKEVEIDKSDVNGDFNKLKIYTWEKIKFEDLFIITLMTSSNAGTKILIKNSGLSEEEFVKKMNEKAKKLGLKNTSFKDPTGLNKYNLSTAIELLKITKKAFSYTKIKQATSNQNFTFQPLNSKRYININNTNDLIGGYLNIEAGKTGYTESSGYCLVSEVSHENKGPILVIVLGSASHYERFSDLKSISTWIFNNYSWE